MGPRLPCRRFGCSERPASPLISKSGRLQPQTRGEVPGVTRFHLLGDCRAGVCPISDRNQNGVIDRTAQLGVDHVDRPLGDVSPSRVALAADQKGVDGLAVQVRQVARHAHQHVQKYRASSCRATSEFALADAAIVTDVVRFRRRGRLVKAAPGAGCRARRSRPHWRGHRRGW